MARDQCRLIRISSAGPTLDWQAGLRRRVGLAILIWSRRITWTAAGNAAGLAVPVVDRAGGRWWRWVVRMAVAPPHPGCAAGPLWGMRWLAGMKPASQPPGGGGCPPD
jgi:hypothetical protein